jgi:hypothetical protein
MNKAITIRCSRSRSGFNIYLPEEAVAPLTKTHMSVEVKGTAEEGYSVRVRPGEGVNRLSGHTDPARPHRLTVQELRKTGLKLKDIELFGVTEVLWHHLTSTPQCELEFSLPPVSQLAAPMHKKRKKNVGAGGRQLRMDFDPKAEDTPHSKLGRLLRDLNALLASGSVDDVEIRFESISEDEADVLAVAQKGSMAQIKGRIVREEILG